MRRFITIFLFLFILDNANAQISIDAVFKIEGNTTIATSHDITITGQLINDGTLVFSSDLTNSGVYDGAGELRLSGADQTFSLNDTTASLGIYGGGFKTLPTSLWVSNTLDLTEGILLASADVNLLTASIQNASASSYIDGKLIRSGAGPLDFPVGSGGTYTPVNLDQIDGSSPSIGVLLNDIDPTGIAGYGLLGVSGLRYWTISDESGTFDGAIVTVPVINETAGPAIEDLVIAQGTASDNFSSVGAGSFSGDLSSGTVTSSNKIAESDIAIGWFFDESLREADSMALATIYETAGGTDWNNATNWLSQDLDSWFGVTVENKRPVSVDLSSNNLTGQINPISNGLDSLKTLLLDNNQLSSVPDFTGLAALATLSLENNVLGFGPIEQNQTIQNFTYAPQDSLLSFIETIEEKGTTYSFNRQVSGANNIYTWYKEELDGTISAISESTGTFDLPISTFSQEGYYYTEVTNSLVTDLAINTRPIFLKVSSLERDSISLLAIHEKMNGTGWAEGSDWPSTNLSEWSEIEINNNRVTSINLPTNNLVGALPKDILDITGVEQIDLNGNNISGLPDLLELPNLTDIDVSNNNLEFDDLEPNMDVEGIQYEVQKPFGVGLNEELPVGSNYVLSQAAGGSQNSYQWYLQNPLEETSTLGTSVEQPVENIQYETMGAYYVEVTNPLVPGLTLRSKDKNLLATASVRFDAIDDSSLPVTEGFGYLLGVVEDQAYDSLYTISGASSGFEFGQVVLGDYLAAIEGPSPFLPTYFVNTDLWVEASILQVRDNIDETIRLVTEPEETEGSSEVLGFVESNFADEDEDGRINARRKVKKAGCSLRRRTRSGGGRTGQEEDIFELIAYIQSNDEGQFEFTDLPAGYYRFNIEYPGIPMDESSFVEFEIGENETFILEAYVTEEGIEVIRTNKLSAPKRELFEDLKVYPVPADVELNVSFNQLLSEKVEISLISLSGHTLMRREIVNGFGNQITIKTADFEGGIYLLRFSDPSGKNSLIYTYKIVVSHK